MTSSIKPKNAEAHPDLRAIRFEEAFAMITGGAFEVPNELQQALYPRLITQDTGLLIPTAPDAGRLEAVVIPSLLGMRVDAAAHRLFIVGPDMRPLDDYAYRLAIYIRNLVTADGVERTLWLEEPDRPPIARTFLPDGSILNGAADHPFSETVDIVAMPFSHFRATFFGSGGIHAMPETIGYDNEPADMTAPRGLIYFDDAFGGTEAERNEFSTMVGFLFAQDLDVVVGSSSLPFTLRDDLAELELVDVKSAQIQHPRKISFRKSAIGEKRREIESAAAEHYDERGRIIVAFNSPFDAAISQTQANLKESIGGEVHLYQSNASRAQRRHVYAQLKALENAGKGYVLVVDGPALEASDLDATVLITEECEPLELVRRTGRCNRRGLIQNGQIVLVGEGDAPTVQPVSLDQRRHQALSAALRTLKPFSTYEPLFWEGFLD